MYKLSFAVILLSLAINVLAQSPHGKNFKAECINCHTSGSWKEMNIKLLFDHDTTGFKLVGQHKQVNCKACHKTLDFTMKKQSCVECHTDMHNGTVGKDCARCHTPNTWIIDNVTDLHQQSRFPLLGAHRTASCSGCHKSSTNLQFEHTGIECVDCHKVDFQNTTNPNHVQGGFPTICTECHLVGSTTWNSGKVAHDFFPLVGGHNVGCVQCHTNGLLTKISKECKSCHQKDFTSAATPNHVNPGIPTECTTCHTTTAWKPSSFNHSTTGFELKGGHSTIVQCSAYHKGNLTSASPACVSCHQVQYNNAPRHMQLKYPTDCTKCHSSTNWLQTTFNHTLTNFPLTGLHVPVACEKCHTTTLAGTPTICSSCHLDDFNKAAIPNHLTAGIPKTCETCHTTAGWKPSAFNHTTTGFELKGGHKTIVQCSACHKGTLTGLKPECISCHQVQYNSAPRHLQLGYPTDCSKCHTSDNWLQSSFNHAGTNFPLAGLHTGVACEKCHISSLKGTPTICKSCHLTNFNQAQLPNHIAAGITQDCETCHTPAGWKPSAFNHTSTGFELTGNHKLIPQCSSCHKGNLTSASPLCISCHQVQYNGALNHVKLGYPTDCSKCHNTSNWLQTSFNHSTTNFPLTGAHITTACNLCHTTKFAGTPTVCFSCHTTKYNNTTNPNHLSAKFPTNCESCHTTTAWTPATFNHDGQFFPVYSGKHKGAWTLCTECHTTSNYSNYSCIICHTHSNKASVDKNHSGVKNYSYTSTACYSCHPRGSN